jgi:virginiamycin B lyase
MRRRDSWFGVLFLAATAAAGCGDNLSAEQDPTASISMDLTQTPPSARCAGIFWLPVGSSSAGRAPNATVPLTADKTGTYLVKGLPTGTFAIHEEVYTQVCSTITTSTVSTWTSDAITVNLVTGATYDLTFNLHSTAGSPSINVRTNYPDPPNAIAQFPLWDASAQIMEVTSGPDGNIWFTANNTYWDIGVMTPAGVFTTTYYLPTSGSQAHGITAGPDGALWFTEFAGNRIGRITTTGVITEWTVPTPNAFLWEIATGADGNLWFTENSNSNPKVGRITPTGTITEFNLGNASAGPPYGITSGSDGNIWYALPASSRIGRLTTGSTNIQTDYPVNTGGSTPLFITAGSDGNLWFAENDASKVGKMTTAGVSTEYNVPTSPSTNIGIVGGPDGNLWFCEQESKKIGRVTTGGTFTEFALPLAPSGLGPMSITAGSDGNLWFSALQSSVIWRIRP